ncbi:MAG: DNA gyrase subunit A [Chloroflexi bacterium]|nr:DNA gyrase subunit A [Chloroflexota bacterium]
MEVGLVRKVDIDKEMQQAYLDYAMSVIVSRALPDARDGLKPVHRRILYAMYDMGLRPTSSHKKSARVVGEVLGKYHPHSDTAVYDAMARMVQDFSMRYPLVDGQGNFGSVDGDPPAAMRYTEARLAAPAVDLLADIQKDTVDFNDNFDDSLSEPGVLPASLPNLLINGATGIAVGMATNVPPHNLSEVVNALTYMLENWKKIDNISVEDLMQFIQGPDFPTGGVILGGLREDELSSAYGSGRGRITVQARAHVEEMGRGRERIIVTELPYMTNKASLIERIANLARGGKITGISDLRDESDRQGMRIVIELAKSADPEEVLANLYKRTSMQGTFGIIMLALVGGEPRLLSLKQALRVFLDHRLEVIRRRSEYDLEHARKRAHILEGLRVALKNLDAIISLIRKAPDVETARARLMKRIKLSEIQAQAILDMRLRRLAALERKKIELEYKEMVKLIKTLEGLLSSPKKMRQNVAEELQAVKEAYGDRRRTQIVQLEKGASRASMLTAQDLVTEENVWVSVTRDGLISRSLEDKAPRQSGKAAPHLILHGNTRDTLYLTSENGETAAIAMHALPNAEKPADGTPISRVCALIEKDKLAAMFTLPPKEARAERWYLVTATQGGMVKKSAIKEFPSPTAQTFQIMNIKEGDSLGWACLSDGESGIWMATKQGMAIRFAEDTVRATGLAAAGVNGIKLKGEDLLIGMQVVDKGSQPLMLASDGKAKRVRISQFPVQGRYGQGVTAWKLAEGVTLIGAGTGKPNHKVTAHLARAAAKAFRFDAAPIRTRPTNGKALLEVKDTDRIVKLSIPWEAPRGVVKKVKPQKKSTPKKTNDRKPTSKKTSPDPKAKKKTTPPKKKSAKPKTTKKSTKKKKGSGTKPKQSKMDL